MAGDGAYRCLGAAGRAWRDVGRTAAEVARDSALVPSAGGPSLGRVVFSRDFAAVSDGTSGGLSAVHGVFPGKLDCGVLFFSGSPAVSGDTRTRHPAAGTGAWLAVRADYQDTPLCTAAWVVQSVLADCGTNHDMVSIKVPQTQQVPGFTFYTHKEILIQADADALKNYRKSIEKLKY